MPAPTPPRSSGATPTSPDAVTGPRSASGTASGPTGSTSPSAGDARTCSSTRRRPARPRAARRGAARQHARLPLRVRRRGARSARAIVGLNHTRRDEHLLRDVAAHALRPRAHRAAPRGAARADRRPAAAGARRRPASPSPATPTAALGASLADALAPHVDATDPGLEPDVDAIWALIFTSGTSDAPKAVICSQRRLLVTGKRMSMIMDLGPDDIGYVCMPLFHSNAVQVGWAPSIVTPCVGRARPALLARRGWLPDVRHYGATYFNYTGKPLAYLLAQPEQPDDADNTLRVAFGNEGSPEVVDGVRPPLRRRGDRRVRRDRGRRRGEPRRRGTPPGALGHAPRPRAGRRRRRQREAARRASTTDGRAASTPRSASARSSTRRASGRSRATTTTPRRPRTTTRFGWYWSGDLGYKDADGYLYFAGPQRRLDPRRRRELPGRPDRGRARATRPASCSPRSTACPTTRPATR